MSTKWDKVGAIAGVAAIPIAGFAIFVQLATPEIRCHLGLDKSVCPHIDKPSIKAVLQVTQSPTATPLPSLGQEKADIGVKFSLPSPQDITIEKSKYLQNKLAGVWIYTSSCEFKGKPGTHDKNMTFNVNRSATEILSVTSTTSKSNFFSTTTTKLSGKIKITYEWSIEEGFLYMKIVDRVAFFEDYSVNGKSVKPNESSIVRVKSALESDVLRGETIKYKILGVEEDSMLLEKIGGTHPPCEKSYVIKYTRIN
jgi:hypothetical protein